MGQSTRVEAPEVWWFHQTASLGGYTTQVLGHPQMIETPLGKAVQFDTADGYAIYPIKLLWDLSVSDCDGT